MNEPESEPTTALTPQTGHSAVALSSTQLVIAVGSKIERQ